MHKCKSETFQILTTLPVTSADVERGFSTMRRMKTYLRSTMTDERFNGLAMMCIHRNIVVDPEEVILQFGMKNRRMRLK